MLIKRAVSCGRCGWLLDTPGMRELQLTEAAAGVEEVFEGILVLSWQCRFSDCAHDAEPGCVVQAALDAGTLEVARFKPQAETRSRRSYNTETLSERWARDRAFDKMLRSVSKEKAKRREE